MGHQAHQYIPHIEPSSDRWALSLPRLKTLQMPSTIGGAAMLLLFLLLGSWVVVLGGSWLIYTLIRDVLHALIRLMF